MIGMNFYFGLSSLSDECLKHRVPKFEAPSTLEGIWFSVEPTRNSTPLWGFRAASSSPKLIPYCVALINPLYQNIIMCINTVRRLFSCGFKYINIYNCNSLLFLVKTVQYSDSRAHVPIRRAEKSNKRSYSDPLYPDRANSPVHSLLLSMKVAVSVSFWNIIELINNNVVSFAPY